MPNREINRLVAGFKHFRKKYFAGQDSLYNRLSTGQSPKTLIVGCSDSRVDPALIYSAAPGELFIVRNVANLVPPYESAANGRHGVSAAIEFAVVNLKVENIVILGHRQCGGIRALMTQQEKNEESFIGHWMEIAHTARQKVLQKFADQDLETQCKECELEAITTSINNLNSFPFVKTALSEKRLNIFGIYFDLEQGTLLEFNESTQSFQDMTTQPSSAIPGLQINPMDFDPPCLCPETRV